MLKLRLATCAASLGLACFAVTLSPGAAAAATSISRSVTPGCPTKSPSPHVDTIGGKSVSDADFTVKCSSSPSPQQCPWCHSPSPSMSTSMGMSTSTSPQPGSTTKPRNLASSGSADLPLLCAVCALMLVAGTLTLTRTWLRPRSATRRGMPGRHT